MLIGIVVGIVVVGASIYGTGLTKQLLAPFGSSAEYESSRSATAPELAAGDWINSEPLKLKHLRGRVVLIDFWTFGCYNCRNTLPFIKGWDDRYREQGLTVIGVHSPEFDEERKMSLGLVIIPFTNTHNDPASNNGTVNYTYDSVDNRLSRNSTLAAVPTTTSAYDPNDRLTSDSYDANGNTRSASGISYTYDFENRIKTANGGAVRIIYDGDGNRVSETVGGTTTKYLVDDLNPTGYSQVMDELVDGSVTRTYAYGLKQISEDQLVRKYQIRKQS